MLIFVIYKFLSVFRRYLPLQIIMTTIERAALILMAYVIMIFPCILAYAIMFMNMWNAYIADYATFLSSMLKMFQMCIGRASVVQMYNIYNAFTVIYLILYYVFFLHFVIVTFPAICIGAFRLTLDAYGYPSDERQVKKWGIRDLVKWVVSCLPEKCLVMMNLQESLTTTVKKKKQEDPEEKKEAVAKTA